MNTKKKSAELTIKINSAVAVGLKLLVAMEPEPVFENWDRMVLENFQIRVPRERNGGPMISNPKLDFASGSEEVTQFINRT